MREDFKDAIDDLSSIGNKIEQTQISCRPNIKHLMDEELLTECDVNEAPDDLMDDNDLFKKYIKQWFDKTRGEFRKVINKVRCEKYEEFQDLHKASNVDAYVGLKDKLKELNQEIEKRK